MINDPQITQIAQIQDKIVEMKNHFQVRKIFNPKAFENFLRLSAQSCVPKKVRSCESGVRS